MPATMPARSLWQAAQLAEIASLASGLTHSWLTYVSPASFVAVPMWQSAQENWLACTLPSPMNVSNSGCCTLIWRTPVRGLV